MVTISVTTTGMIDTEILDPVRTIPTTEDLTEGPKRELDWRESH